MVTFYDISPGLIDPDGAIKSCPPAVVGAKDPGVAVIPDRSYKVSSPGCIVGTETFKNFSLSSTDLN